MNRLLKADFSRLFKSLIFKLGMIFSVGFALVMVIASYIDFKVNAQTYAEYGYTEDKKQGLRKWYTDYINKEISYNGTKIGLPEEVLRCKPCHESNFKYATQVAAFKEPSNIIEIIQSIFSKITRLFEYRSNKIETE